MTESHKIAFVGMDNAGKTSIINVLSQNFSNYQAILPTQRVERNQLNFLGKELMIWDFGGQDKYREAYLATPEKYFESIDIMYFVVDIQDLEKLNTSIQYFRRIIDGLDFYSPNAQITILYHKNDLEAKVKIQELQLDQKFYNAVKDRFEYRITEAMKKNTDSPIRTYYTSIQNPLSIIKALSEPLIATSMLQDTVADILEEFIKVYNLKCAILFTKHHFELGSALAEDFQEVERDDVVTYFINNVIPSTAFELEMSLKGQKMSKMFIDGFDIPYKSYTFPFFLLLVYDKENPFPDRENAMAKFKANFKKLMESLNVLELYARIGKK